MSSTDVLKADRILVDERIYRVLPVRESLKTIEDDKPIASVYFEDDEAIDPELPITHQGDRFFATIHAPASLIGFVVGKRHANVQALKQQYDVKINVPEMKNIEAGITIQGSTQRNVSLAYMNIQSRIAFGRSKSGSTHFISFPVNSSNIQESFLKFKDEVLTKYKSVRGIDASIFQKSTKLHVTVSTLILLDERDKENSIAILNKCTDSFRKELGEKEIVVRVQGLEIMNDDEAEVDVLYAKLHEIDDDNRLQILADKIMKEFKKDSFSKDQYDQVKLHVTLMNTIFRQHLENKDGGDNDDGSVVKRITFDARRIMKEYGDYDFGQVAISEIHISIRYTEAFGGYYNCLHKIKMKS